MSLSTKELVKKVIQMLTSEILNKIQGSKQYTGEIKSLGLIDAEKIIDDYLKNDELGLAFDHLNYVISEVGVDLTSDHKERIQKIGKKLNVSYVWLAKPLEVEIAAFYELVNSFNQRQKEVVKILRDLWNIEFPMTNTNWMNWHHQADSSSVPYEKRNIKIFPHGYGLSMKTPEFWIDFDFGDAGEINGFDAGRLLTYNQKNTMINCLDTLDQFQNIIDQEVQNGNLKYSGYINYYKS